MTRKLPTVKLAPEDCALPLEQITSWVRVSVWVRIRVEGNLPGRTFAGGKFPCSDQNVKVASKSENS